ncbi:von Willebrand factor type A domain protein [Rubripirellula lacrimiformis]|uniref:von Willebrand factor type A domain protein n=1 Tax=Rubripirellula lacrimiformis TaxID=1930273 RepID=A0A517NAW2_9BACT|nr:VWA domain-containing protein [Rubripirellula lacrimiformis]QDT04272.1 von Willebrand factor type A domain protein [Rubripirellula lacrimiformis]
MLRSCVFAFQYLAASFGLAWTRVLGVCLGGIVMLHESIAASLRNGLLVTGWIIAASLIIVQPSTAQDSDRQSEVLIRQLTARNESVRQQALMRFSGQPEMARSALPTLIDAVKIQADKVDADGTVPFSLDRLLHLIGTIRESDAEGLLVEMLDHPSYAIAMIAADSLGQNRRRDTIEFLKKQVDRPIFQSNYGFRFNLVRALALMRHPDAVEFLTSLEANLKGQLRFEVETLLAEVTEKHFLDDQDRYLRWKASRQPKVVIQRASFGSQSTSRMNFGKPQKYYDIDIHAKRMLFLIDRSGSMQEYSGGMTRLERAKIELAKAVQALPSDSEFGIIFFEESVRKWKDQLLPATQQNKDAAMKFVHRLGYGQRTNTYGALYDSLQFDDELEVVFLLSDGRPTMGRITHPQQIVADIIGRNRLRNVKFNTIGIAIAGETEQFLKTLAEQSNGEFRNAE